MHCWRIFTACYVCGCCEAIAKSYAKVRVATFSGGFGRSWRKRSKRYGDKILNLVWSLVFGFRIVYIYI